MVPKRDSSNFGSGMGPERLQIQRLLSEDQRLISAARAKNRYQRQAARQGNIALQKARRALRKAV